MQARCQVIVRQAAATPDEPATRADRADQPDYAIFTAVPLTATSIIPLVSPITA